MTIKDCIDETIKKHPNFTCALILEAYFMISDRARAADPNPNLSINPNAFSSVIINGENIRDHVRDKDLVIKEMEDECKIRLGDNIESFISCYVNWYNNIKQNTNPEKDKINEFDKFRQTVNDWIEKYSNEQVKELLIQNSSDPKIMEFIKEGSDYVSRRGGIDLTLDMYDRFIMFINNGNNYYKLYDEEKGFDQLLDYKKIVNNVLELNLNDMQKANILFDIYQGNYNPMLSELKVDIKKEEVLYTLLRNTLRAGLVCANKISINNEEKLIFDGLHAYQQADEIVKLKEFIINKLCINDHISESDDYIEKINSLTPDDIMYMCVLYIKSNKKGANAIEEVNLHNIDEARIDKSYYDKVRRALKLIEDRRFRLSANKIY